MLVFGRWGLRKAPLEMWCRCTEELSYWFVLARQALRYLMANGVLVSRSSHMNRTLGRCEFVPSLVE